MKKSTLKIILAGLTIAVALTSVSTISAADNSFYFGAGVSKAFVGERGFDEDDTAAKVYGWYKFNSYLSVEAAYYNLGETEDQRRNLDVYGVRFAAIDLLPLTHCISVFAKGSVHVCDAEARGSIANQLSRSSDTDAP